MPRDCAWNFRAVPRDLHIVVDPNFRWPALPLHVVQQARIGSALRLFRFAPSNWEAEECTARCPTRHQTRYSARSSEVPTAAQHHRDIGIGIAIGLWGPWRSAAEQVHLFHQVRICQTPCKGQDSPKLLEAWGATLVIHLICDDLVAHGDHLSLAVIGGQSVDDRTARGA